MDSATLAAGHWCDICAPLFCLWHFRWFSTRHSWPKSLPFARLTGMTGCLESERMRKAQERTYASDERWNTAEVLVMNFSFPVIILDEVLKFFGRQYSWHNEEPRRILRLTNSVTKFSSDGVFGFSGAPGKADQKDCRLAFHPIQQISSVLCCSRFKTHQTIILLDAILMPHYRTVPVNLCYPDEDPAWSELGGWWGASQAHQIPQNIPSLSQLSTSQVSTLKIGFIITFHFCQSPGISIYSNPPSLKYRPYHPWSPWSSSNHVAEVSMLHVMRWQQRGIDRFEHALTKKEPVGGVERCGTNLCSESKSAFFKRCLARVEPYFWGSSTGNKLQIWEIHVWRLICGGGGRAARKIQGHRTTIRMLHGSLFHLKAEIPAKGRIEDLICCFHFFFMFSWCGSGSLAPGTC